MTFNFRHTISRWNIHREMRVATTQRREIHRSIVSGTENKIVSLWILNACDIRAIDDVPRCISDASEISCIPQVHTSDKSRAIGIEESIINLKRTAFTRYFERPLYVCHVRLSCSLKFRKMNINTFYYRYITYNVTVSINRPIATNRFTKNIFAINFIPVVPLHVRDQIVFRVLIMSFKVI